MKADSIAGQAEDFWMDLVAEYEKLESPSFDDLFKVALVSALFNAGNEITALRMVQEGTW